MDAPPIRTFVEDESTPFAPPDGGRDRRRTAANMATVTFTHSSGGQVPPGWYPDPGRPGLVRWWSGRGWTEHTAVSAPAADSASLPYAFDDRPGFTALNLVVPSGRSVATRSLVWGIVSLLLPVVVISAMAIAFGAIGVIRARTRERAGHPPDGRGRAIAGIVLGSVSVLELVLFTAWMAAVRR